ncbi:unnamed protein product [Phytomonas sp. Hart1]|nr:unnamed protein product [Phytomonas sp. Hart1]|eukprot:CCW70062.1 unnamed protein product [Phytomonas sp. isolate Hart1]
MASFSIDGEVEQRYLIQRHIGSGAYGVVWCALDRFTGNQVALKKVFDAFRNHEDAQRTYREIMLLETLKENKRVVHLLNVIQANNNSDLYLVFELAETDLCVVLQKRILQDIHRKYIIYQIVLVVAQLHAMQIIHRDLKPANVFINADCSIKLGDFGLARSFLDENDTKGEVLHLTEYIATRWYRSPEVLVKSPYYTTAMDMWAVGCVIAELFLGEPLFCGRSTHDQLILIISSLGEPTSADVNSLGSSDSWAMMDYLPEEIHSAPLRDILSSLDADVIDLVSRLVIFNPQKRLTALEALRHPYLAEFVTPDDITLLTKLPAIKLPLPDEKRCSVDEYKENVYERVRKNYRHREQMQYL